MCQYLASEVHRPILAVPSPEAKAPKKRVSVMKKPATASATGSSTPPVKHTPKVVEPAPPTPLVSQLMEMGFPRKNIEHAVRTTQNSNPEQLISWLLDHGNLEVPDPDPTPATPDPKPDTPPAKVKPVAQSMMAITDSSSDSSDYSDDLEEAGEEDGMCVCVLACVCIYMYMCLHVCIYMYMCLHVCASTCTCACVCASTCTCACMCVHLHVHVYVCVCTHVFYCAYVNTIIYCIM